MVEPRWGRSLADDSHHFAVVLTAVGHRCVRRVGNLQRELPQARRRGLELLLLRGQLVLVPTRGLDLLGPPAGRGLADLLAGHVVAGAQGLDLLDEQAVRGIGLEHLVDQALAHTLALDAAPVLRLLAEPLQVDHSVVPDLLPQRLDPGRRVLPRPARGAPAGNAGRGRSADRIGAEELDLRLLRREVTQRVCDDLVGDMAFAVDEEAIVAQAALRRT